MRIFCRIQAPGQILASALAVLPLSLLAQTAPITQDSDWRRANETVGTMQRGHADVLKWEQRNLPSDNAIAPNTPALPSLDTAIRLAWQAHPDLGTVLAQLGAGNVQLIAQGQWMELDPSLQRRVEGTGEVLEVALRARKAWTDAVAAQQVLKHRIDMVEAASAAKELGERMVAVGNWSKLQQAPVTLMHANARMNLRRAQYAADMAQSQLVKTMGQTGRISAFSLPQELPSVPRQARPESTLQQHAHAIGKHLPVAEGMRSQALFRDALKAYQAAHALALDSSAVVLETRTFITEETVLHYNGMLKSVWDLLEEVRNQSQATLDAIGAQRDFWTAEADLQWVLQGGEPVGFVSLSGAGADTPQAAAH